MRSRLSFGVALALPLLATLAGYLAFGWWGLAGGLGGALAAWVAKGAGGGLWVRSLAASLPPLLAAGPSTLLVVGVFALVLAWQRSGDARVFLFGGLALFVPYPGASFVATACSALLIASARGRWIAAGAGLSAASWILAPTEPPAAALLGIGIGFLARALAHHPANASVARALLFAGVLFLGVPALAALGFVAAGLLPGSFMILVLAGLAAAALGAVLLAAQAGLAALHLSDVREPAVWSALTWAPLLGVSLILGSSAANTAPPWALVTPLLGLSAVAFALGTRWLSVSRMRQQVSGKA